MALRSGPSMSAADMVLWKSTTAGYHRLRSTRVVLTAMSEAENAEIEEAWEILQMDPDEPEEEITHTHLIKAADIVLGKDAYRVQDIKKAMAIMDLDGNGKVNFYEFKSYMISASSAAKDAETALNPATAGPPRRTKDGQVVSEDMLMIGTMRVTDLIRIYRRRIMMEQLLKAAQQLPKIERPPSPPSSPPSPSSERSSPRLHLPVLLADRRSQRLSQQQAVPDIEETVGLGLGGKMKRMFGRLFGSEAKQEKPSPSPHLKRDRSYHGASNGGGGGGGSEWSTSQGSKEASVRNRGGHAPHETSLGSTKGGFGGSRAAADWGTSVGGESTMGLPKCKSRRQAQLLQDATILLQRAEESKAAAAAALQADAALFSWPPGSASSPTSPTHTGTCPPSAFSGPLAQRSGPGLELPRSLPASSPSSPSPGALHQYDTGGTVSLQQQQYVPSPRRREGPSNLHHASTAGSGSTAVSAKLSIQTASAGAGGNLKASNLSPVPPAASPSFAGRRHSTLAPGVVKGGGDGGFANRPTSLSGPTLAS